MSWMGLPELLKRFDQAKLPPESVPFRERSGLLALQVFDPQTIMANSALVNVAGMYLQCAHKSVLEAGPGICGLVAETDLDNYPHVCPVLMERAGIISAKKPERPLFGQTSSLGWYWLDNDLYLIGAQYPDGVSVAKVTPKWSGEEITGHAGTVMEFTNAGELDAWTIQAVRFLLIFALLLEAENTPVMVRAGRVIIDQKRGAWEYSASGVEFTVRGHLRHQAHGPGHSMRRWIWIEEHASRRWIEPK